MMYVIVHVFLFLVYLYVKVYPYFVYFVHYCISPVMLDVTFSLGSNSFSLVLGYSVCDQSQVGTSVSVASLLSDVSMGRIFLITAWEVIMYDCLWQHVHICL